MCLGRVAQFGIDIMEGGIRFFRHLNEEEKPALLNLRHVLKVANLHIEKVCSKIKAILRRLKARTKKL